jgi:hypothetical protein
MLKEQLKKIKERIFPKKDDTVLIILLSIFLFLIAIINLSGDRFGEAVWTIDFILFGGALLIIMVIAGFATLKSLFFVAAELSLLIFLSQSYCDISNRSIVSDNALKTFVVVGLLYIIFNFFHSLYKTVKKYYKKSIEKNTSLKERIFGVIVFLIFTTFFMVQIYLIVNPIILNICVYK